MPWDTQFWGAARARSGQGVEVHRGQWLPPVAEVAVFRVGQVCAGATGHRWEEEFNHLAEPFVPTGRRCWSEPQLLLGFGPITAGGDLASCLGALDRGGGPWQGWGGVALGPRERLGCVGTWQGLASRGLVIPHELLAELSPGVDCEDAGCRQADLPVGSDILQETRRGRWAGRCGEGGSGSPPPPWRGHSHWACSQRRHRRAVPGAERAAGCHSGRQS